MTNVFWLWLCQFFTHKLTNYKTADKIHLIFKSFWMRRMGVEVNRNILYIVVLCRFSKSHFTTAKICYFSWFCKQNITSIIFYLWPILFRGHQSLIKQIALLCFKKSSARRNIWPTKLIWQTITWLIAWYLAIMITVLIMKTTRGDIFTKWYFGAFSRPTPGSEIYSYQIITLAFFFSKWFQ